MFVRTLALLSVLAAPAAAQINPEWTTNHQPFRIAGNLYYVGSQDLAAYLIVTPQGNILLNANLASSVPQIRENIEKLGFRIGDTKILLNSQAHWDHAAGLADMKNLTHARLEVMVADAGIVETGGRDDFFYYNDPNALYLPAQVDRILHDGDRVTLGKTTLVAHLTPGHTKGCTTWTMQVEDSGHTYNVVIIGGAGINTGYNLINDPKYPQMAADFAATFRTLRALPCDIFLGAHGLYFNLKAKYARLQPGKPNPFVDPNGYKAYIDERQKTFETELARQKAAHDQH